MDCLSRFGGMSKLRMNVHKSKLYAVDVHGQKLEDIHLLTNMPRDSTPFHYLGIPLAMVKLKISSYDSFINKITAYVGA